MLFTLIASHVPKDLHRNLLIVGSLAAAYHHRGQLLTQAVVNEVGLLRGRGVGIDQLRAVAERVFVFVLDEAMSRFPPGWDEERVKKVLAHYEAQSDEEALAEDEAAYETATHTTMGVPVELVPAVRELIAKRGQQG